MKKFKSILLISSIIILIIIIVTIILLNNNKSKIINITGQKLNTGYNTLYTFEDGSKVYTQFPDIEYINKNGDKIALQEALKDDKTTIEKIIAKANRSNSLNDGGSKIYYFDEKYANKSFDIVKCNTSDGIKDIYILENADLVIDTICIKR